LDLLRLFLYTSTKIGVFDPNFQLNTSIFIDLYILINMGRIVYTMF